MDKPEVFTAAEIDRFRTEIAARRAAGAFEPGRWSVSPLNRDRAVTGPMPASIRFRDATLRSIETMPGVVATDAEKQAYLRQVVRAGVGEVVGAGAANRTLDALRTEVDTVKGEDADCRVVCPLVFSEADIDKAAEAGYDGVQVWVQGFGETAQIYKRIYDAAWEGVDWRGSAPIQSRAEVLATAQRLVAHARSRELGAATPMLMVSYLPDDMLAETVEALVGAGATEVTLFDGPGAVGPEAFGALVRRVRELAPDVEVGLHPHNTFGLAVACSVAAARAGAAVVELSVNGYCGGPGNADLAATTAAFEVLYGVHTGIRTERLTALARAGGRSSPATTSRGTTRSPAPRRSTGAAWTSSPRRWPSTRCCTTVSSRPWSATSGPCRSPRSAGLTRWSTSWARSASRRRTQRSTRSCGPPGTRWPGPEPCSATRRWPTSRPG